MTGIVGKQNDNVNRTERVTTITELLTRRRPTSESGTGEGGIEHGSKVFQNDSLERFPGKSWSIQFTREWYRGYGINSPGTTCVHTRYCRLPQRIKLY